MSTRRLVPRSRLYRLAPVGVGTPCVESLTSYLLRLSAAHSLTPGTLVTYELFPALDRPGIVARPAATWLRRDGHLVNGTGGTAQAVLQALARQTQRPDLASLTLRPWADVLAPLGLLRRTRAWCAACYADWEQTGAPTYEPLLWMLDSVRVCPQHGCPLTCRCPYPDCRRELPVLSPRGRAGWCAACRRCLSRRASAMDAAGEEERQSAWHLWVAEMVGQLLAAAPTLQTRPSRQRFAGTLTAHMARVTGGDYGCRRAFTRLVGVRDNLLASWLSGEVLPTLDVVLRVCRRLGITPLDLLTGKRTAIGVSDAAGPMGAAAHDVAEAPPRATARQCGAVDLPSLQAGLEAVLTGGEIPPPSVHAVVRRLGCTNWVYKRFPELCNAISARHRAYQAVKAAERHAALFQDMREVMSRLVAQGIYPASKRVIVLLQHPVHPKSKAFTCARRQLLQELGVRPTALVRAPAPSPRAAAPSQSVV
ncbi:MAG TPA: TniQ family protein [Bacillota bacterium]|nr:TniQ family protein [Bacillota bacterium]